MYSPSRRVLAAGLGALALVVVGAAACKPDRPRPPLTTRTTVGTVPGTIDCGTLDYASGAPTTRMVVIEAEARCFLDALAAGRPARWVTTNAPDNLGRPIGTVVYDVLGLRSVRVTTPSRGLVQECQNASIRTTVVMVHNCWPQPPAAPPLVGRDCGRIEYAAGWPTTFPVWLDTANDCFLKAWAAGTPARVITRDQTDGDGGHIRIVIYDILGAGQLRVITDNRQARDGGGITTERCTALTASTSRYQPGDCTPA